MVIAVLVIVACLLLNALLAAVEMAFVTVGKPELRQSARNGNSDAQKILKLRENPERTLSVIQIGVTLVGAVGAAVGGAGALETISPALRQQWGWSGPFADLLSIVIVILPLTYLNVLIGELVPKSLAMRHPMRIMLKATRWLTTIERFLLPAVGALEWSTRGVLKLLTGKSPAGPLPDSGETVELGALSLQTREYVLNLVGIEHKRVRDVLVPWDEVIYVRHDQSASEVESVVIHSGHTRLPVVLGDAVIGILNTKEFLSLRASGQDNWGTLIRPALRVQEGDSLLRTFRAMQEIRSHLCVVYRQNEPTGIITMEDVLEEIIGEVFDEDDDSRVRKLLSVGRPFRTIAPKQRGA